MSNANPASSAMRGAVLPVAPGSVKRLAALAAGAFASVVTVCAVRRAYRELAALDDRLLADIGFDRATVEGLAAHSLRQTWLSLAHLHWHRTHTGA